MKLVPRGWVQKPCKLEATAALGAKAAARGRSAATVTMSGTGGRSDGARPPFSPSPPVSLGGTDVASLGQRPFRTTVSGHRLATAPFLYARHAQGQSSNLHTSQAQTLGHHTGHWPCVQAPHQPCMPSRSPPSPAVCPSGPHHLFRVPAWPL